LGSSEPHALINMQNLAEGAGGVAQGVELLHSKCEALSSNPSMTKREKKKEFGKGKVTGSVWG
jgi:hypothetical protein